jgi:hypothetical protein
MKAQHIRLKMHTGLSFIIRFSIQIETIRNIKKKFHNNKIVHFNLHIKLKG